MNTKINTKIKAMVQIGSNISPIQSNTLITEEGNVMLTEEGGIMLSED